MAKASMASAGNDESWDSTTAYDAVAGRVCTFAAAPMVAVGFANSRAAQVKSRLEIGHKAGLAGCTAAENEHCMHS